MVERGSKKEEQEKKSGGQDRRAGNTRAESGQSYLDGNRSSLIAALIAVRLQA